MPLHLKKILAATDFSSYSRAAVDAASMLARTFDAEVTLLHVIPLTVYTTAAQDDFGFFAASGLQEEVRRTVQKEAEGELERLRSEGLLTRFLTVDGPPPSEIARVAHDGEFDLVVIGTHGRTGLLHLALGSVAESVVRLSTVSVLVVRSEASEKQPGRSPLAPELAGATIPQ